MIKFANLATLNYGVENDGNMMKLKWADGEKASFHAVWLRHNCQCASCVAASNQKKLDPSVLDAHMKVLSTRPAGQLKLCL